MIDSKPLVMIQIAAIVLVLAAGMIGTGQAGSLPSMQDRSAYDQTAVKETAATASDTHDGPLRLAMNGGEEDRRQLQELLAVLDEETAVATKTKMNNDYVPGMVTVLHGDQLEALGAHTVAEALSMVPGIQMARLTTGEPTLKVRGVAFPFNAGNVKVMLNSIALSRESSGINSSVLLIPVAQVDRIEVIRGPGSSIYGDFAMAGVVNIITKDTGGRLFGLAGDDQSRGGGGHYFFRDDTQDLSLGVNMSAVDDGENAAALGSDPDENRSTGIFSLNYKKFSFTAEGVRRKLHYRHLAPPGGGPPPPPGTPPVATPALHDEASWAMEGRQTIELGSKATLDAHLTYLRNSYEGNDPSTIFKGDRLETGIDLTWSPLAGHQVLFSASYADSEIDQAEQQRPLGAGTLQVSGIDRKNYSLGLQDQVTFNERFSMTLGVRYDDYDDVGSLVTPRIAALYRLAEHHVVKAQYSRGFRAPTFWELYSDGTANRDLDFEVMDTTELSYVYRRPKSVGRVTLYYSKINDGIYGTPGDYGNIVDIEAKGVEAEWEQRLGEKFRWQANLSYNDTWDGRSTASGHEPTGVADWIGNLAFFVQPVAKLMLTARLLHVGDRYTPDGRFDGYDTVDLTVSRLDLWRAGITLRCGVKNILDDKIVYLTDLPSGLSEDEFPGRTWWMQLSYDF